MIADIFNKTMLGLAILTGLHLLYLGEYRNGAFILFILIPVYFFLYDRYGGFTHNE